jgi:hypothetical protein
MQPRKSIIPVLFFLVGGILLILGQNIATNNSNENHTGGFIMVVVGLLLVFFGIYTIRKEPPKWLARVMAWMASHAVTERRLIALALCIPIAFVVPVAAGSEPKMINPVLALSAWFLAIGLFLVGTWEQPAPLRWPSWKLVAITIGITLVAFLIRAIMTTHIPIMLTGDEGSAGMSAEDFSKGTWNNIFITSWYAFPSFFFAIPSLFISILGHTTEALRIPAAFAGALTVTASFFVARAMFGKRAAWFTAVFLAALHFHIHFSRIGLNNIWDGLWYTVTIGAFWYGWEKGRRNAFLLAGFTLGLSQYFYSSSHGLLALIVGCIGLAVILDRPRLKQSWTNLLFMFIIAGIVVLPLAWYYIYHPNTFMEPLSRFALTRSWLQQEAVNSDKPVVMVILKQVGLAIGSFTNEPLRYWYTPGVPLLRPFAATLFFIGIILLFFRKQKWHIIPIILWLIMFMIMGGLSDSVPAAQRYVASAPACALLVGFGLSESTEMLQRFFDKNKRLVGVISIILVTILSLSELNFYFRVFTPHSLISEAHSNGMVAQTLAEYLKTQEPDTQVIFFGTPDMEYTSIPSILYLVPEIKANSITQPWSQAEKPEITAKKSIFVFLPNNLEQIPAVQMDYPNGKLVDIPAVDGGLLYKLYEVTNR